MADGNCPCASYSTRADTANAGGYVLNDKQQQFALKAKSCPAALMPNENQAGYYVSSYEPAEIGRLLSKTSILNEAERSGVVYDLGAGFRDGRVPFDRLLTAARMAADSGEDLSVFAAARAVVPLGRMDIPDDLRPGVARFIDTAFLPRLKAIGWTAGSSDTRVATVLRPALAALMVLSDRAAPEARARVQAVVEGRQPASSVAAGLFRVGARNADRATLEALTTLLGKAAAVPEQSAVGGAIGSIETPELANDILKVTLRPGIPANGILAALQSRPAGYQPDMLRFVEENYDNLA